MKAFILIVDECQANFENVEEHQITLSCQAV